MKCLQFKRKLYGKKWSQNYFNEFYFIWAVNRDVLLLLCTRMQSKSCPYEMICTLYNYFRILLDTCDFYWWELFDYRVVNILKESINIISKILFNFYSLWWIFLSKNSLCQTDFLFYFILFGAGEWEVLINSKRSFIFIYFF